MKMKSILTVFSILFLITVVLGYVLGAQQPRPQKAPSKERMEQAEFKPALDIRFEKRITGYGEEPGKMQYPTNVTVDNNGKVYLADTGNHRIQVVDSQGNFIRSVGKYGRGDGELSFPADAKADKFGNIFVADMENHRIVVFDSQGNFQRNISSMGKNPGFLMCPYGIELDEEEGHIYIADTMAHRMQKFTLDGQFVKAWGEFGKGPGQFHFPRNVALSPAGEVYVADAANNRIQIFDKDGNFQRMHGDAGCSLAWQESEALYQDGQGCPDAVEFAPDGSYYVADMLNHRIKVYDANDNYVTAFGSVGYEEGQFFLPKGVAVDQNGNIWVAHSGAHTLDKYVNYDLRTE